MLSALQQDRKKLFALAKERENKENNNLFQIQLVANDDVALHSLSR